MEIVTATINKAIRRFGMPILLSATAKESKMRSLQVVTYFECAAARVRRSTKYPKQN
jgi:hypothetical protein